MQTATYKDISGAANMTQPERQKYDAAVRRAEGSVKASSRHDEQDPVRQEDTCH